MPSTPIAEPTTTPEGDSSGAVVRRVRTALHSTRAEIVLATVLVVISSVYLIQFLRIMAHTSMWNDELVSVLNYSSRGPHRSLTSVNDSMILPNFINSVFPGSASLDPLRQRFLSMVAVVAMQMIGLAAFVRRRWYLPGALLFFVFAVNFNWLDEMLQDRGYGILGLCALVGSLCIWRFLEDGRRRWLGGLAAISLVGAWTVPTFVFFLGPAWALLWATRRERKVVGFALGAAAATVVAYTPVLGQLWHQFTTYSDAYGHQYGSVTAPLRTFWDYLFDRGGDPAIYVMWMLVVAAPLLVLLPARLHLPADLEPLETDLAVDAPQSLRATVRVLLGAAAGVIVIALILTTPPQRTVAYLVVPVAVATAASLATLGRDARKGTVIRGFTVLAAVLACVHGVFATTDLSVTPIENWSGAATYIQRTFPDRMSVAAVTRGIYLTAYLGPGQAAGPVDPGRLRSGAQVVAMFDPNRDLVAPRHQLAEDDPGLVEVDLPQRRGVNPPGAFPLLMSRPDQTHVQGVTVNGAPAPELLDADLSTHMTVEPTARRRPVVVSATLVPGTVARSLVLALGPGQPVGRVQASATDASGRTTRVAGGDITVTPGLVTLHLGDRHLTRVTLTITPRPSSAMVLRELWAYSP